jgi:hypothetical protein
MIFPVSRPVCQIRQVLSAMVQWYKNDNEASNLMISLPFRPYKAMVQHGTRWYKNHRIAAFKNLDVITGDNQMDFIASAKFRFALLIVFVVVLHMVKA